MSRTVVLAWILCLFPAAVSLGAELRLAAVFGDHMVLQRDQPVCVWGHSLADAHVSVRFAGQEQTTRADGGGHWKIHLAAQPASAQGQDLVVTSDGQSVTVADVLVGEVWLLGGQSNMEMPLWWRADGKQSAEGTRLVLETDHPWLRVMTVTQAAARHPQETFGESVRDGDDVQTLQWRVSKSRDHAISGFSALGYYIALELYAQLGVPIGLIDTSWGGRSPPPGTHAIHWSRFPKRGNCSTCGMPRPMRGRKPGPGKSCGWNWKPGRDSPPRPRPRTSRHHPGPISSPIRRSTAISPPVPSTR